MLTYLAQRFFAALLMIFIACTIVFFIIHLLPGDPVTLLLGDGAANPEVVAAVKKKLKLDLPLPVQYTEWVKGMAQLDLGSSLQTGVPVTKELVRRVPRSLELIFCALFFHPFSESLWASWGRDILIPLPDGLARP